MKSTFYAAAFACFAAPAAANDFQPAMEAFLSEDVIAWSTDPVLIDALNAGNAATSGYSQDQIDMLDQTWRAEIGTGATPTIDPVLSNAASDFLRGQVEASGGRITEVILMDARGLNVAVSEITSDMWQGDEAKHSETYGVGPNAVHFSEIEQDESTGMYQGQISFAITDPATGELIGAITIGVDAEALL